MFDVKCPFADISPEIFKEMTDQIKQQSAIDRMKYDYIANVFGETIRNMVYDSIFEKEIRPLREAISRLGQEIETLKNKFIALSEKLEG